MRSTSSLVVVVIALFVSATGWTMPGNLTEARVAICHAQVVAEINSYRIRGAVHPWETEATRFDLTLSEWVSCPGTQENLPEGTVGKFTWGPFSTSVTLAWLVTPQESACLPGVTYKRGGWFLHLEKGVCGNFLMFYGKLPEAPPPPQAISRPCAPTPSTNNFSQNVKVLVSVNMPPSQAQFDAPVGNIPQHNPGSERVWNEGGYRKVTQNVVTGGVWQQNSSSCERSEPKPPPGPCRTLKPGEVGWAKPAG